MSTNLSHLAGEFLVAGELSRRGYPVSITMGNAKSVDIYADTEKGPIKIDAKATKSKTSWYISKKGVSRDVYYIFVILFEGDKVKANSPEYYIIKGSEIIDKKIIQTWAGNNEGIRYLVLKEYKDKWDLLPIPVK